MPIRTGVSPRALMMKGDENCTAAIAALDFRIVRRSSGQDRCEKPMLSSQTSDASYGRHSSMPLEAPTVTRPVCFCQLITRQNPATFGLGGGIRKFVAGYIPGIWQTGRYP